MSLDIGHTFTQRSVKELWDIGNTFSTKCIEDLSNCCSQTFTSTEDKKIQTDNTDLSNDIRSIVMARMDYLQSNYTNESHCQIRMLKEENISLRRREVLLERRLETLEENHKRNKIFHRNPYDLEGSSQRILDGYERKFIFPPLIGAKRTNQDRRIEEYIAHKNKNKKTVPSLKDKILIEDITSKAIQHKKVSERINRILFDVQYQEKVNPSCSTKIDFRPGPEKQYLKSIAQVIDVREQPNILGHRKSKTKIFRPDMKRVNVKTFNVDETFKLPPMHHIPRKHSADKATARYSNVITFIALPQLTAFIKYKDSRISVSWACFDSTRIFSRNVDSYMIYSLPKGGKNLPPPLNVASCRCICKVKSLPLPMTYVFNELFDQYGSLIAVVPIDRLGRMGKFSNAIHVNCNGSEKTKDLMIEETKIKYKNKEGIEYSNNVVTHISKELEAEQIVQETLQTKIDPPYSKVVTFVALPLLTASITIGIKSAYLEWNCFDGTSQFLCNVQKYLILSFPSKHLKGLPSPDIHSNECLGSVNASPLPLMFNLEHVLNENVNDLLLVVIPVDRQGRMGKLSNTCRIE